MSARTIRISFEESDWGDSWIATAEGFRGIGATKDSAAHDVLMQIREAEMAASKALLTAIADEGVAQYRDRGVVVSSER